MLELKLEYTPKRLCNYVSQTAQTALVGLILYFLHAATSIVAEIPAEISAK